MQRGAPRHGSRRARARARWAARQGLLGPPIDAPLPALIARTGWVRTLGGVDGYLAVSARAPGLARAALDAAAEAGEVRVTPAVRGCIYYVPATQQPLCLRVAEEQARPRTEREMEKLGVSSAELAEVGEAVVAALAAGPTGTDALRKALPAGVVRALGEAGKKLGVSSTLPPALRALEFAGRIERTLPGGRLDTERYAWRLVRAPLAEVPGDAVDRLAQVARHFLGQAAPATLADFAAWAGTSQKAAKEAFARLPLVPVEVPGYADVAWAFAEDLDAPAPEGPPRFALVPFEDNHVTVHGGPVRITDARWHDLELRVWGTTRRAALRDAKHVFHRGILRDGELVGFWEHDAAAGGIVLATLGTLPAAERSALEAVAADVGRLLAEIGHARSFSLDSAESIAGRAAAVRAMDGAFVVPAG